MAEKNNVLRALQERDKDIYGEYHEETHRLTLFIGLYARITYNEWRDRAESIRRRATQRRSTVGNIWCRDPSAPALNSEPPHAIVWDSQIDGFVPAVNVCNVTQTEYFEALTDATEAAGEANLFRAKYKRFPTAGDLTGAGLIFIPGRDGANVPPEIASTLRAINGGSL